MPQQVMTCENCDASLGKLSEAYVWLDRPVCKRCFKHLSATNSVKYRGLWMPLAIGAIVMAVGAAATVVVLLNRTPPTTGPVGGTTPVQTAKSSGRTSTAAALHNRFAGTKWEWGKDTIALNDDGTVQQTEWTERGLVTRWAAIDERTVVLVITKGRANNVYAQLRFSDDLTRWSGANFEGGSMENNRRITN